MSNIIIDQAPANEGNFRLGLEEEGLNVFPNGMSTFEIPLKNGKWDHGLSKGDQEKVEDYYGRKFDNPDDRDFWGELSFEFKYHLNSIDMTRPDNILKVSIGKQIGLVARDVEQIEDNQNHQFKLLIKDKGADQQKKLSLYQRKDEAIAKLLKISKNSKKHLLAIAFQVTPNPYELGTNSDLAYTRLRELIEGLHTDSKYEGIDRFEAATQLDKARLYALVDVKWAMRKNIIRRNGKMRYYNPLSNVEYGKTEDTIVDYLLDPLNQDEYGVGKDPAPYSIKEQLKRYNL